MHAAEIAVSGAPLAYPSVVRPPTLTWAGEEPTPPDLAALPCPNCGSQDAKSLVLRVRVELPDHAPRSLALIRCPSCTACFYDDQRTPDYAEPKLNERGRVPFYVQQGAGVWLITRPVAQVKKPPGSAYMEVGCGFGFGLDYAIRTKGWVGRGMDPAPLSGLGAEQLGVPIELRYLREDDEARGSMDVVMGSEVIEHVTSPLAFVRTLRAMLKPGGVLVLTTPNADHIVPAMPPGIIVPLISPTLHTVMQNATSMRALLGRGGFAHVEIATDSHALVVFASDAPLDIETDPARLRDAYRAHLSGRAATLPPGSDIFLGYAGRALQECSNDADAAGAERAWQMLLPACRERFGLDLDTLDRLPDAVATCGLEEMATLVPLNLGGILYARSIQQVGGGVPRPTLERRFALAAEAADAMRRALGQLAMEDGLTEQIGWIARAEALLCAAYGGDEAVASRLGRLGPAPGEDGAARRRTIAE
ncbi:MAG TPA: class I SAM-dependent methyltransferase, partial [Acetobacteraceae bacterium]|nr:class I SAM-dependent methyltransferase [Acetobacteraceae bacterium]